MVYSFWTDIKASYKLRNVALYFAWSDTKARYKRSFLGPLWIVLATMIGVLGLGAVWSIVLHDSFKNIIPSITLGLVFWYFISGCILEAPSIFIINASSIKGSPNPYIFFVFKHIIKHLILLAHNMLIIVAVCIYFGILRSTFDYAMFLLGLGLALANIFWISTSLAIINTRFRDIELILSSIMPIMFFITPVIFRPQQIDLIRHWMYLNPFANLLILLRDPLYSGFSNHNILAVNIVMLILGMILTAFVYKKMIKEVPYLL